MAAALTRLEFAELVRDTVGLEVEESDLGEDLDVLSGWDSLHLLTLLVLLERRVARPLSLPDLLDARSLESIYEMVTR